MTAVERVSLPSASGVRRMRDILAVRFLNNRDKTRLFRVSVKSNNSKEVTALEGFPSTKTVNAAHLRLRVPGVGTFRVEWSLIVGLEEVDTSNLEERTTDPNLPFASD